MAARVSMPNDLFARLARSGPGIAATLQAMMLPSAAAALPNAAAVSPAPPPRTTGSIRLSLSAGTLEGRACMANVPTSASSFALNAGLNVARVADGDGRPVRFEGWYEPGIDGEARIYRLDRMPGPICVSYTGKFPVYPRHDAPTDFKGVIAFDGDSVRAAEQAAWLPTPVESASGARLDESSYDLDVACDGCRWLYLNGGPPRDGSRVRFTIMEPRPILLFGGGGPVVRAAGVTIVNEEVSAAQARALSTLMAKLGAFYLRYMGKPIEDRPILLRLVAIDQAERDRTGSGWGFATWPTIALSGSVAKIGDELDAGGVAADRQVAFLAHEMGHYYFGHLAKPRGPYFWFLLESTAEFLAIAAQRRIGGNRAADRHVSGLLADQRKNKTRYVRLDQVASADEIGDGYRYRYGPLLLLALEKRVGTRKMRAFVRGLMSTPVIERWPDLQDIARSAGIADDAWERWQADCVAGDVVSCVAAVSTRSDPR